MSVPAPDPRPHVPPLPAGSEACGCCDGIVAQTPQGIDNRSGLSAIAYRIGTYDGFRSSLQAALSSSKFAALAGLRTRDDDDFTIGLIDAFACAADVLTFYQERIANESYLRTAVERLSLQEMGKLVGYRLRPGVAAETWLAFALETPPAPPANLPPEPGNFVTGVPARLTLDVGLKVQSVPGPNEKPQTFETVETLADARPEWNAMRPWMSQTVRPGLNDTFTYFAGLKTNLKPGDAMVFVGDQYVAGSSTTNWDFRLIDIVELQADFDRTLVRWKRPLTALQPFTSTSQHPQAHVLRKRAAAFGHNAPMWDTIANTIRRQYPDHGQGKVGDDEFGPEWPNFVISRAAATADGGPIDLDTIYGEVHPAGSPDAAAANASYAVLAKGNFNFASGSAPTGTQIELYKVVDTAEVSRAEFMLSGKVSRLRLKGSGYSTHFRGFVRETAAFVQSEPLPFAPYPVDSNVSGDQIPLATGGVGLLPGRKLVVRGKRASDGGEVVVQATLVAVHAAGTSRCSLEITPPLAAPLRRDSVVVHGNVALASHGETVSQILGSGSAGTTFQRFELKQLPLTYRAAANEIGAAAELTVRIGDVAWTEKPSLFGASATEHAYTLVTDEQARQLVVFGDGKRGARLPTAANNVRASYRKGLGNDGNVAANSLSQLVSRPLGLKSVGNPLAAEGGTDPEPADAARRTMPLGTRTLGRAVSLLDYEDFARAYSGIGKAQARVLQLGAVPTVVITLAGPKGAALTSSGPVWQNLLKALKENGDPHVPVVLLSYQASPFRLGIRVKCAADRDPKLVLSAVEATLRERFAFDARELGQPIQQSEVVAVAQAVPGVVAVDLTRLYGGTQPYLQTWPSTQLRLLASRMRVQGTTPLPAELLTLAPGPLDKLEQMT